MFLKTESFEHNGVTVTLSELSALQRIEHLALMKRQAEQAESDSNRQVTVEDVIRNHAAILRYHADIGAHTHSVAIGSHGHTITVNAAGNAENTVKNIAFNYIVRLA